MKLNFQHLDNELHIKNCSEADIPSLTKLLNEAYKELADMGLNYTASYQDEKVTAERLAQGQAFNIFKNEELLASILYFKKNYFTKKNTAYIGQFGVKPNMKKMGLGSMLMDYCKSLAKTEGYEGIQLDTAKPALHLVNWYKKRGYKVVGELHWDGKTYDSYIFEKIF